MIHTIENGSLEEKEMVFQNGFKIEAKDIKESKDILEDGEEYMSIIEKISIYDG